LQRIAGAPVHREFGRLAAGERCKQRSLADPRLAFEEQQNALASERALQQRLQRVQQLIPLKQLHRSRRNVQSWSAGRRGG
jgi:hypothetical protein